MEIIHNSNTLNSEMVTQKSTIQQISNEEVQSHLSTSKLTPASTKQVSLSEEGKLTQKIDAASNEIDKILLRYVSPEQKKELNGIYTKLEGLFSKESLTGKEEKSAEVLFEQVHNILESSIDKLSTEEHKTVDKLGITMDTLSAQLEPNEAKATDEVPQPSVGVSNEIPDSIVQSKQGKKKSLTVAQLNALSVMELNKLPANQLKKLNSQQLNKLNAAKLNSLDLPQLKQLTPSNVEKLNQVQTKKITPDN